VDADRSDCQKSLDGEAAKTPLIRTSLPLSRYTRRFALLLRKEPIAKLLKAKFEGSAGNRVLRLWGALLGSNQHRQIGESGSAA
jgi:hypothetical protein